VELEDGSGKYRRKTYRERVVDEQAAKRAGWAEAGRRRQRELEEERERERRGR